MRRGFTIHELLISLTVLAVVLTLATHFAVEQLRFFAGVGQVVAVRSRLDQAAGIVRNALWGVSPAVGDLLVAGDSAVEFRLPIGTAMVCDATPGSITVPLPNDAAGNTISSFIRSPEPGDHVAALFSDSIGTTWLHLTLSSAPQPGSGCPLFAGVGQTWQMALDQPLQLPPGSPLRFSRPLRLSLYRSSDGKWYLGARDWNGALKRLNTIQPVAGPFQPYGDTASGIRFTYSDVTGATLPEPVDVARVASVRLTARATARGPVRISGMRRRGDAYDDSAYAVIRLRNAW